MNTEGLTEVAVKEAQPVVEQITETPPELEPAPPAPVADDETFGNNLGDGSALANTRFVVGTTSTGPQAATSTRCAGRRSRSTRSRPSSPRFHRRTSCEPF